MIKSITLSNFFSFAEKQTVELDPYVNILIGINGSGKSNFIKAIELLSRGVKEEGIQGVISDWWGLYNIKNHKFNNDNTPIELAFLFTGEKIFGKFEEYKKSDFLYSPIIYNTKNNVHPEYSAVDENITILNGKKPEIIGESKNNKGIFAPTLTFQHKTIEGLRGQIEEIVVYDNIRAASIRVTNVVYDKNDIRLKPSIENFASLLYQLHVHYPEYEDIEKLLHEVNPHFKEISFISRGGNKIEITMEEGGLPLEVTIRHISTGTLKFLALLAILYNPNRGKVVCLEEPEQGLHPDMIKTVADGIKYAARNGTQMIVSTHSPFLLDFFQVDNVLVFEKDKNNETRVTRKTEEDYEGWLDKYTAGDLWMTGKMGGVR